MTYLFDDIVSTRMKHRGDMPPIKYKKEVDQVKTDVYMSEELNECCKQYCGDKGISYSSWVRSLVMAELSRRGKIIKNGAQRFVAIKDR